MAGPASSAPPSLVSREVSSSSLYSWLAPLVASVSGTTTQQPDLSAQQSDEDRTGLDPKSAIFRKLLAGILYSRWLAFTYYGVVAAVLVVFVVANWVPRSKAWFKSRSYRQGRRSHSIAEARSDHGGQKERLKHHSATVQTLADDDTDASGSSSPVLVTERTDENRPLLNHHAASRKTPGVIANISNKVSAWLTYQPRSLPGFRDRVMPSNGTTLVVLVYLAISLFYLLFNIEFTIPMLFVLADRASQLFVTNLPILYILGAKNQPLQPLVGYSYASLNIVHRRLGEWMCFLAAVHAIGMFMVWATLLRPGGYDFVRFAADPVVFLGLGAFLSYEVLYFTSLATIRQMAYEIFLATHIILQVGALAFLYFHHSKSHLYVLLSIGIWAVDRVAYRLIAKTKTFKAALTVFLDGETIGVSVSIPLQDSSQFRKLLGLKNIRDGWQTLDHVFLNIPALAHKHILQSHPFSIASAAPTAGARSADLEFIIRARDGFSKDLLVYAAEHDTVNVRIDGPYGAHSASRLLRDSDARVIIAGGSGIAVTYPLLKQLLTDENSKFDDVEHATHLEPVRPILFVWVVHRAEQWSWIDLEQLKTLGSRAGVEIVLPEATSQSGRPDLSGIINRWFEMKKNCRQLGMVVSGPDGMSREVCNECAALQAQGHNAHVEIEKYGW